MNFKPSCNPKNRKVTRNGLSFKPCSSLMISRRFLHMETLKYCHHCFCFIIFFSSVFLFLLFYINSDTLTESKNDVLLTPDEYVNLDLEPHHNHHQQQRPMLVEEKQRPTIKKEKKLRPISHLQPAAMVTTRTGPDPCLGRYIYVHDLPSQFNDDMLKECVSLSRWTDMCKFLSNRGLGPQIRNGEGAFSKTGWFATNQFALDIIFNNRMKHYKCLTRNSSLASAIFVPFFAGLDVSRYLWEGNTTIRDFLSLELIKWLKNKPEWQAFGGRDHFLVGGRITWDFRRHTEKNSEWGNKLLLLPQVKNMTVLVIESSPWNSYDFGIPYPTYFHPSKDREVSQWQRRVRGQKRRWLFSFAGAARPENADSIRGQIINQCLASKSAKLLDCHMRGNKCYSPSSLMKLFQRSVFCLQPQGDSYTRRSSFDSILAGCIPVFFHPGSAYIQYTWHLPLNHTSYSVFISENDVRDGKVNIETTLLKIPRAQVKAMREKVIQLIPRIIYADPRSRLETLEDAFDIAVKGVLDRISRLKKDIREGRHDMDFEEDNSWKLALRGDGGEHEWDSFFYKPMNSDTQGKEEEKDLKTHKNFIRGELMFK